MSQVVPTATINFQKPKLAGMDLARQFNFRRIKSDSKVFPGILVHENYLPRPINDVYWTRMPDNIWRVWNQSARYISRDNISPKWTPLGKELGPTGVVKYLNHILHMLKQLDGDWPELYQLEVNEFADYLETRYKGLIVRGAYLRNMALTRLVMSSYAFHHPDRRRKYCVSVPLPPVCRADKIRVNTAASVGWPWLLKLNALLPEEQKAMMKKILHAAASLISNVSEYRYNGKSLWVVPKALLDWCISCGFINGQGLRAQSQGRPVIIIPKVINFITMAWNQPLGDAMARLPYNLIGDGILRYRKMARLFHEKSDHPLWRVICDGDDLAIILEDGSILLGDGSGFDTSIAPFEHIAWLNAVAGSFPTREEFLLYAKLHFLVHALPITSFGGFLHLPPFRTELSGEGGTHNRDTWWQASRATSALRYSDGSFLDVVKQLNKYGAYRLNKQYHFKNVITVSQKIVHRDLPGAIFGKLYRIAISLVELEDDYLESVQTPWEVIMVMKLSSLLGHPLCDDMIDFVKGLWKFSAKESTLRRLASSVAQKIPSIKFTSDGGAYERMGIRYVIDRVCA